MWRKVCALTTRRLLTTGYVEVCWLAAEARRPHGPRTEPLHPARVIAGITRARCAERQPPQKSRTRSIWLLACFDRRVGPGRRHVLPLARPVRGRRRCHREPEPSVGFVAVVVRVRRFRSDRSWRGVVIQVPTEPTRGGGASAQIRRAQARGRPLRPRREGPRHARRAPRHRSGGHRRTRPA